MLAGTRIINFPTLERAVPVEWMRLSVESTWLFRSASSHDYHMSIDVEYCPEYIIYSNV